LLSSTDLLHYSYINVARFSTRTAAVVMTVLQTRIRYVCGAVLLAVVFLSLLLWRTYDTPACATVIDERASELIKEDWLAHTVLSVMIEVTFKPDDANQPAKTVNYVVRPVPDDEWHSLFKTQHFATKGPGVYSCRFRFIKVGYKNLSDWHWLIYSKD